MSNVGNKFIVLSMLLIIIPIIMLMSLYSWDFYRNIIFEMNGKIIMGFDGVIETIAALMIYFILLTIGMYKFICNNFYKTNDIQENLKMSEERYRIIMNQKDDIIFQWNALDDTIFYSDNWWEKFDYDPITNNVVENIKKINKIYEDDIEIFHELVDDIIEGSMYRESEIRIMTCNNEFKWFKVRITGMLDDEGKLIKAVGTIIDIDNEKKEKEELLYRIQRDGLTKLYNKDTIENIIRSGIGTNISKYSKALLVIDLDDFKNINDNLGHLNGDYALKLAADNLKYAFKDASIGRIGGDEFVVFLNQIKDKSEIIEKVEVLIKRFRESYIGNNKEIKLSCSIGIAQNFDRNMRYEEFFEKADKALYKAKEKGKDTYFLLN